MVESDRLLARAPATVDSRAAELWTRYLASRDPAVRDEVAARYDDLARILAARAYSGRISTELEFDDYLQFARIGLLESIDRFDPSRGAKFETFSGHRITGAILNGVESLSEKQKQVSVRQQVLKERAASQREGAAAKGHDTFERLASVAIGLAIGFLLEDSGMYAAEEAVCPDEGYRSAELRQLCQRVREAVQSLPPQEQHIIMGHYLQHQPFETIARGLGLTKGRISQVHHAALARLRQALSVDGSRLEL